MSSELNHRNHCRIPAEPAFRDHPKYRPDIDGLRAIAVLSVVLFHAFPKVFRGGFIGVDIFFVISGFLISTIIFNGLEHSSFSFVEFYARRVRRIFPALAIVLIGSLAFGWFYLLSGEFAQLGKHVAAGAGFISNFVLWGESGYFDNAADTKPMLHLWSLGIEEQFYILWPFLLWGARKLRLNFLAVAIALAGVSFLLNVEKATSDIVADFYSPQTRFWELMFGAILAYAKLHRKTDTRPDAPALEQRGADRLAFNDALMRDIASSAGALLIFTGIFTLQSDNRFPGWWALVPTLGAILVIAAGPAANVNRTILSNRVMIWFGLISFPLYLWHWPILTFSRLLEGGKPPFASQALSVCISVVLAWLTVKLVETRIRNGEHTGAKSVALVLILLLTGAAGYGVYVQDGVPSRAWVSAFDGTLSKLHRLKAASSYNNLYGQRSCFQLPQDHGTEWFVEHGCLTRQYPDRPTVFLLGDSHSASLSLGLRPLTDQLKLNFLQLSSGWCPPFGNLDTDRDCVATNNFVTEQIRLAHPDVLILDAHWLNESTPVYFKAGGDYMAHLQGLIAGFERMNVKRILLVGQIPTWNSDLPDVLARRFVLRGKSIPDRTFADLNQASLQMDARMRQLPHSASTTYVSLRDALCNDAGCLTSVGPDPETDLLVWDYGHLTRAGSIFVTDTVIREPLLKALDLR